MMPYMSYDVTNHRMNQAKERAEASRLRRAARSGHHGAYGAGVIDALGHGLIALGSRLVSDSHQDPKHRHAA
jgi:hypothetical protein